MKSSSDLLKHSHAFILFGAKIQCIPFTFNKKGQLECCKSSRLIFWYLNVLYTIAYTIYLWVDLVLNFEMYTNTTDFVPLVLQLGWCNGFAISASIRIDHLVNRKGIVYAANQLMGFIEETKRT